MIQAKEKREQFPLPITQHGESSQFKLFLRALAKNRSALLGAVLVSFVVLVAILAPVLAPQGYTRQVLQIRRMPPSLEHPLGTDELGRSILNRLIWGARISIIAGVVSVGIGVLLGILFGLVSGYFGGRSDTVLMGLVDIMLALPFFLWAIVFVSALGPTLPSVIVAIGAWTIPSYARVVRSQTFAIRENLYVEAARAIGVRDAKIIQKYVLPNVVAPIVVLASLQIGSAILAEAALSFLGLGIPPPEPSWGAMLFGGRDFMRTAPHISIIPGIAIVVTVLGFNFLGDGIRDALDPKLRT